MLADSLLDGGDASRISISKQRGHLILQDREVREDLCFRNPSCPFSIIHLHRACHRATLTKTALENLE